MRTFHESFRSLIQGKLWSVTDSMGHRETRLISEAAANSTEYLAQRCCDTVGIRGSVGNDANICQLCWGHSGTLETRAAGERQACFVICCKWSGSGPILIRL